MRRFPHRSPFLRTRPGLLAALLATVLAAACAGESVLEIDLPSGLPIGVFFRVNTTPTEIATGEEMRVVVRLENTNDQEISLFLPSSCTFFFIVEDPDGTRVFPQDGNECSGATHTSGSALHLLPNHELEARFTWTGVREVDGAVEPAPSGSYRVFGVLGEPAEVRTSPREVTIR